jgi:hypothetical protein
MGYPQLQQSTQNKLDLAQQVVSCYFNYSRYTLHSSYKVVKGAAYEHHQTNTRHY